MIALWVIKSGVIVMSTVAENYDTDFYQWANTQAQLLRSGNLELADIEHIAEEIESMGKSEKRELISRLEVLLTHLLKWKYQPVRQSRSWKLTIEGQRYHIENHLGDNPSLKNKLSEVMESAYHSARISAASETNLEKNVFPESLPWSYEQIMDDDFWP